MPLPLRADAGDRGDLAVRLDLDPGAFERADAGPFDVGDDADPHLPALGAQPRLLLLQEAIVSDSLQCLVEHRLIVAAVVIEGREILINDHVVVRELVRPQIVAPADLGPVDPELASGEVHQPLDHEDPVLAAGAAVRRDDRLVGEDRFELARIIGHPVRSHQRALAVERHGEAVGIVGAGVVQERVLDPEDAAVARQRDLRVVDLAALLGRGEEVLGTVLDPFDRLLEPEGEPGDQHLLGIEHHDLGAEAAADEGRHEPHLVLGEPEHGREAVAHRDRRLGRVPDRQLLDPCVPLRHDATVLDRRRGAAVVGEAAADHHVGLRPRRLVVPLLLGHIRCDIRAHVLVHQRHPGLQGLLELHHGRQRLVVDVDVLQRVLGHVAGHGHDQCHRLADMAHLAVGQRDLRPLVENHPLDRRRRHQQRPRLPVVAQILGREDRDHALALEHPRRVDAEDAGMRVRAAQEGDMRHLRQLDVVDELGPAGQEARVFIALDAFAKGLCCHCRPPVS